MSDLHDIVDGIVAPLADIAPAERGHARDLRRRRLVLAFVVSMVIVVLAAAATWTVLELTADATRTPVSPRGELACLDLVGGSAGDAAAVLRDKGYLVKWRLVEYQPPDGSAFSASEPRSVPETAIVEDVVGAQDGTVIVLVHGADDAYAPAPRAVPCPE
ncbi:MAG: hypothetical protein QOJ13_976 [Gaiellales bacterium]|jgi:hypothetical protein|nr:hypothetical protein [Gaiellales bacterium]